MMKLLTGSFLLLLIAQAGKAQYYYKDLVVTKQTADQWKLYKGQRVKIVKLNSFEFDGKPTDGFQCDQEVSGDLSRITTHTRSSGTPESWILASYSPAGLPVKIMDTSDTYQSVSEYQYDAAGQLVAITNTSMETDNHLKDVEQHLWSYDPAHPGTPSAMLKVKNGHDSTIVRFVTDERGNIVEERARRNKADLPVVYYYYDSSNRLTDIVRYRARSQRLIPDNVFEYDETGKLNSMLVVPEDGNDYQKWMYAYNERGLKVKEACYNKQRELSGKIEYQYSYR